MEHTALPHQCWRGEVEEVTLNFTKSSKIYWLQCPLVAPAKGRCPFLLREFLMKNTWRAALEPADFCMCEHTCFLFSVCASRPYFPRFPVRLALPLSRLWQLWQSHSVRWGLWPEPSASEAAFKQDEDPLLFCVRGCAGGSHRENPVDDLKNSLMFWKGPWFFTCCKLMCEQARYFYTFTKRSFQSVKLTGKLWYYFIIMELTLRK